MRMVSAGWLRRRRATMIAADLSLSPFNKPVRKDKIFMADPRFPKLFSPLRLRGITIKNRIFSTGHDTNLAAGGLVNDRLASTNR